MRVSEKLALINQIARILSEKEYLFIELDAFLDAFGLSSPVVSTPKTNVGYYVKAAMVSAPTDTILRIAEDLQVDVASATVFASRPPKIWEDTSDFRLFISHISENKDKAARLSEALARHNVRGFVAHEDIEPTKPWQQEIERALYTMEALVAVHTLGFKDSTWTQQEIGFALGRGAKVISLKMEQEDPTGLISKDQALSRKGRTADQVAAEIVEILRADKRTADRIQEAQDLGSIPF